MKADQLSATALLIPKAHVFLKQEKRFAMAITDQLLEPFLWFIEEGAKEQHYEKKVQQPLYRWVMKKLEWMLYPGIMLHYALRKRVIEQQTIAAIENGITQVIMLAGGFDPLCYRLQKEYPHVKFLEVDHPATQKVKQAALQKRKAIQSNLQFYAADFNEKPLMQVLRDSPLDPNRPSVCIAEGLLMYFDETVVRSLFNDLSHWLPKNSIVIFTYMEKPGIHDGVDKRDPLFQRIWLKIKSEPLRWSVNHDGLDAFLKEYRFEKQAIFTYQSLQQSWRTPKELMRIASVRGDHVAVCRKL